jgi:hypothetical protein
VNTEEAGGQSTATRQSYPPAGPFPRQFRPSRTAVPTEQIPEPRRRVSTGIGVVLVVAAAAVITVVGLRGNADVSPAPSAGATVTHDDPPPITSAWPNNAAVTGSTTLPVRDGDWRLDSLNVAPEDFTYHFSGRAAITYTGHDNHGGDTSFAVSVFKNGRYVATLSGSAAHVMPGTTTTVALSSIDPFISGAGTYSFQTHR